MDRTKMRFALLVGLTCLLVSGLPAMGTVWNAAANFSETNNPSGPWNYNYWAPGVGSLTTGGTYQGDENLGGWTLGTEATPYVLKTRTGAEYVSGGVQFLANELTMKSNGAAWSIVTFVMPTDGDYYFNIEYTGREEGGSTHVQAFSKYGNWDGGFIGYGESNFVNASPGGVPGLIPFAAGDTLDMYIEGSAVGLNAYFTDDASMVPEPSALVALCSGFIGTASLVLRRRRA